MKLELRGLRHRYDGGASPALDGVDLSVAGGLVGLLGPNGSGKSTLLRCAAGLLPPVEGSVWLGGHELGQLDRLERARRIAFLPQRVESLYALPVREVVALGRHPHRPAPWARPGAADRAAVEAALAAAEVDALADRPFDSLSGGERQRVLLASMLAQGGELLLLDEPTTALDLHHQVRLFRLLRERAGAGQPVLCALHDLNLAARWCERVVLLHEGRVRADGPPAEVLDEALLAEVYGDGLRVVAGPQGGIIVLPEDPVS